MKVALRTFLIALMLYGIMGSQFVYDARKVLAPDLSTIPSPRFLKTLDLGLHSTIASYLWLFKTRTDFIKFLFLSKDGQDARFDYLSKSLDAIHSIDSRYAPPYAFTVIALPNSKYSERLEAARDAGLRGIAAADPRWEIPFYLAVLYHIELKDQSNAAKYFDVAGHTPGAPVQIRSFALNYGIAPSTREKTKQIWQAIFDTADDETTRERAKAYIIHLTILAYLEEAAQQFKKTYGRYPVDAAELVEKKILTAEPEDPFGFKFSFTPNGEARIRQGL